MLIVLLALAVSAYAGFFFLVNNFPPLRSVFLYRYCLIDSTASKRGFSFLLLFLVCFFFFLFVTFFLFSFLFFWFPFLSPLYLGWYERLYGSNNVRFPTPGRYARIIRYWSLCLLITLNFLALAELLLQQTARFQTSIIKLEFAYQLVMIYLLLYYIYLYIIIIIISILIGNGDALCGGAIIAPNFVITAGILFVQIFIWIVNFILQRIVWWIQTEHLVLQDLLG